MTHKTVLRPNSPSFPASFKNRSGERNHYFDLSALHEVNCQSHAYQSENGRRKPSLRFPYAHIGNFINQTIGFADTFQPRFYAGTPSDIYLAGSGSKLLRI